MIYCSWVLIINSRENVTKVMHLHSQISNFQWVINMIGAKTTWMFTKGKLEILRNSSIPPKVKERLPSPTKTALLWTCLYCHSGSRLFNKKLVDQLKYLNKMILWLFLELLISHKNIYVAYFKYFTYCQYWNQQCTYLILLDTKSM